MRPLIEKNKQLVSIVMPAYNCEEKIHHAIESVKSQTYCNWELIIVDDCSKDETLRVIENYANSDKRILSLKNIRNKGAAESRNIATDKALGHYIAFLDSDDFWSKDKLLNQITFMESNSYDFTYTYYEVKKEYQRKRIIYKAPKILNKIKMSFMCPIGCLTVMYNVKKIGKIYAPKLQRRNDYILWIEILRKSKLAFCLNQNLATYKVNNAGLSSSKLLNIYYYFKVIKLSYKYWYLILPLTTPIYLLLILIKKTTPEFYNIIIKNL